MTPEERKLVTELFDRLAALEDAPRDREAEGLILDGLRQAPNATYALVQTVLVQDEALKSADARIRELEDQLANSAPPPRPGGFLDAMRDSVWGRRDTPRAGSVPTVRPSGEPSSGAPMGVPPGYRIEAQPMGAPAGAPPMGQPAGGAGGSFLGTAAATAAGVIGGTLLMNSIRSMMGGHQGGGSAHAAADPMGGGSSSPWGGSASGGELARQAGLDDIGRGSGSREGASADRGYGLADAGAASGTRSEETYAQDDEQFDEDDTGDFDADFGGGGDE